MNEIIDYITKILRNCSYYEIINKRGEYIPCTKEWEQHFQDVENIRFSSPDYHWPFSNFRNGKLKKANQIKMYVSLDKEHIKLGVQKIFDFMAENNVEHISKVRENIISNDNVVIRVESVEDAKKISQFINSNPYLIEGSQDINKLTYTDGIVAFTCDGEYSYNSFIETIVKEFLSTVPYEERSKLTGREFMVWYLNWYKETYLKGNIDNLNYIYLDIEKRLNGWARSISLNNIRSFECVNIKQMSFILLKSLLSNKQIDEFYNYYSEITNEKLYRRAVKDMEEYIRENLQIKTNAQTEHVSGIPTEPLTQKRSH